MGQALCSGGAPHSAHLRRSVHPSESKVDQQLLSVLGPGLTRTPRMRALASQERLTFKRAPASFAVSTAENSKCCLFIGVFLLVLRVSGR